MIFNAILHLIFAALFSFSESVVCPNGSTIDQASNGCVARKLIDPADFTCPSGYLSYKGPLEQKVRLKYGVSIPLCEQARVIEPIYNCDRAFHFIPSAKMPTACRRVERSSPIPTCPSEFKLDGASCVQLNYDDAEMKCLPANETKTFENGNSYKPKLCQKTVTQPPIMECPKAYSLRREDGICVLEHVVKPTTECLKGLKRTIDGTGCLSDFDIITPEVDCPQDASSRGRNCIKRSVTPAAPFCDPSFQVHLSEASGSTADLRKATCFNLIKEKPELRCMKGFQMIDDVCIRHKETSCQFSCPSGSYNNGAKKCLRALPLQQVCPMGFFNVASTQDVCERSVTLPPIISCEDGFQVSNNSCRRSYFVDEVTECPHGLNRVKNKDICEWTDIVAGIPICEGSGIEETSAVQRISRRRVSESCFGKRWKSPIVSTMFTTETVHPSRVCNNGERINEYECERIREVASNKVCPRNFVLNGERCDFRETQLPIMTCPKGLVLDGKRCHPPSDAVSQVQFIESSENLGNLLVSSWDGGIRLYNSDDGSLVSSCSFDFPILDATSLHPAGKEGPTSLQPHKFVFGGLSKRVLLGDFLRPNDSPVTLGSHESPVRCLSILPDSHVVFSGSWDKSVKMWDLRSKAESQRVKVPGKVFGIAVATSPSRLVVCDSTKTVTIFDIRKGLAEPEQTREQILKFQLRAVDCFPDGKGYAVSSVEGRVAWEYFDPSLGPMGAKKNYAFKCHRDKVNGLENIYPVNAVAFHPTLGSFATGGGDGGVSVWDGYHKKRLWKVSSPFDMSVTSLSFSSVGARFAIGLASNKPDATVQGHVAIQMLNTEDITRYQSTQ